MCFGSLPSDLFPEKRSKLWRKSNSPDSVIRFGTILDWPMPRGLIYCEPVRVHVRQSKCAQFPGPESRFAGQPVERPPFTLRMRNDLRNILKKKVPRLSLGKACELWFR